MYFERQLAKGLARLGLQYGTNPSDSKHEKDGYAVMLAGPR